MELERYYLYCPICGESSLMVCNEEKLKNPSLFHHTIKYCPHCKKESATVLSKYSVHYYRDKALDKYNHDGQEYKIKILEEEEIFQNPKFSKEAYDKRVNGASVQTGNTYQPLNQNVPKCPTCQSTNISKISAAKKVASGAAFGLFSRTAKSQFKCSNCGYKW